MKVKYLGMFFDSRLTWTAHIKDLADRCRQPMNILRKVAGHDWGGDRASLRMLYMSLIRSKIDYGSFLYSTASQTNLLRLDRIQYAAIRIITGNMRSTLTSALEVEAHIMPLRHRRQLLALQYFGKKYRITDHIIRGLYDDFYPFGYYRDRPYPLPVVGRCQDLIAEASLPIAELEQFSIKDLHYVSNAQVRFSLYKPKAVTTPLEFQARNIMMRFISLRTALKLLIGVGVHSWHICLMDPISKVEGCLIIRVSFRLSCMPFY